MFDTWMFDAAPGLTIVSSQVTILDFAPAGPFTGSGGAGSVRSSGQSNFSGTGTAGNFTGNGVLGPVPILTFLEAINLPYLSMGATLRSPGKFDPSQNELGSSYSFVFEVCITRQSKIACGIILLISISFAIDARLYGVDSYYGEQQSPIWNNIQYIALCAHFIFVSSFISITRIRNGLRSFLDSITSVSLNNDYETLFLPEKLIFKIPTIGQFEILLA